MATNPKRRASKMARRSKSRLIPVFVFVGLVALLAAGGRLLHNSKKSSGPERLLRAIADEVEESTAVEESEKPAEPATATVQAPLVAQNEDVAVAGVDPEIEEILADMPEAERPRMRVVLQKIRANEPRPLTEADLATTPVAIDQPFRIGDLEMRVNVIGYREVSVGELGHTTKVGPYLCAYVSLKNAGHFELTPECWVTGQDSHGVKLGEPFSIDRPPFEPVGSFQRVPTPPGYSRTVILCLRKSADAKADYLWTIETRCSRADPQTRPWKLKFKAADVAWHWR